MMSVKHKVLLSLISLNITTLACSVSDLCHGWFHLLWLTGPTRELWMLKTGVVPLGFGIPLLPLFFLQTKVRKTVTFGIQFGNRARQMALMTNSIYYDRLHLLWSTPSIMTDFIYYDWLHQTFNWYHQTQQQQNLCSCDIFLPLSSSVSPATYAN